MARFNGESVQPEAAEADAVKPRFAGEPVAPRPRTAWDGAYDMGDEVMNTVTFGAYDEIMGGLLSPFIAAGNTLTGNPQSIPEAYSNEVEKIRAAQDSYRENSPIAATTGALAGGLMLGGAAAPKIFSAASGPVLNTLKGIGAGGVGAFLSGFGEGRDSLENRLEKGVEEAPVGMIIGGAIPAAAPLVGKGVRAVAKRIYDGHGANAVLPEVDMSRASKEKLDSVLAQDGLTYDTALQRAREMGPDAMLLDVAPNLSDTAEVIANMPGRGQIAIREALQNRRVDAPARITGAADTALGPQQNMAETVDDLIAERSAAARPLYDAALDKPVVWTDRLDGFLKDPIIRNGLREGVEIQRLEALARNEPFDPTNYAITDFDAAGDPIVSKIPNMRTLHTAKIGLDNIIERYRDPITGRLNLDGKGRAINEVQRAFIDQMDASNPTYAEARKAWAGPSKVRDAMSLGQDIFDRSVRPDQLRRRVAAMGQDELEGLQIGLRDQLEEVRGTARNDSGAARALFEKGWNREKLEIVLGEQDAAAFFQNLTNETGFENARRQITGNSRTMPRTERAKEWTSQATALEAALPGESFWSDAKRMVARGGNKIIGGRREVNMQAARDQVGQALSARGGERDAVLEALQALDQRNRGNEAMAENASAGARRIMEALLIGNSGITDPKPLRFAPR